jgi:hypothetical protein
MLHKKEDSQSLSFFYVQQAVLTPALRAGCPGGEKSLSSYRRNNKQ